jgi:enoyl-CoA hydratase
VGLSACDVGTSYFLPRLVGPGIAAELMLTGRLFDAAEAREMRLISKVLAPADLERGALTLARSIAENSEYGVWMTKKGLWSGVDAASLRQAMEIENRTQVLGHFTGAMSEARAAFRECRKPLWKPL